MVASPRLFTSGPPRYSKALRYTRRLLCALSDIPGWMHTAFSVPFMRWSNRYQRYCQMRLDRYSSEADTISAEGSSLELCGHSRGGVGESGREEYQKVGAFLPEGISRIFSDGFTVKGTMRRQQKMKRK